ncbi:MAG TPA: hypothetical protein VMX57_06350, partial [Planctomycetota bacterium]|nr:hypothetical protein [Planctomycetota bacterium]
MKYVTFILTLGLIGVFLTACVQAGPGTSSAAVPAVTLREEIERYPDGQIHTRYTYYLGLAGRRVKHGLEKAYTRDGQLIYQEEYR